MFTSYMKVIQGENGSARPAQVVPTGVLTMILGTRVLANRVGESVLGLLDVNLTPDADLQTYVVIGSRTVITFHHSALNSIQLEFDSQEHSLHLSSDRSTIYTIKEWEVKNGGH